MPQQVSGQHYMYFSVKSILKLSVKYSFFIYKKKYFVYYF